MRPDEVFEQVIPYSPVSETADGGCVESVVETAPGQGDVLRRLPSGGGVYLLTDERDRTVLLSAAGDLRRALRTRLAGPAIAAHGGAFLARGSRYVQLEGKDRARNVVARFPSLEDAVACYRSAEYQAALEHAKGAAERDLVIVEENPA